MFVNPKKDCPHLNSLQFYPIEKFKEIPFHKLICDNCDENKEIWICLSCAKAFCSRYINNHYQTHIQQNPDHCICISLMDLSVWCYHCKTDGFEDPGSYIESEVTSKYVEILANFKFGSDFKISTESLADNLNINFNKTIELKYQNFIELLKNKKFKKICFLLGAGISTSAGIPDFRSETGYFTKIKEEYKLKHPEDLFSLDLFKNSPELLYSFFGQMNFRNAKPTLNHYFMKFLQDKGWLDIIFTQNIDCLEEKAGLENSKIVYSHGKLSEGHCIECHEAINVNEIYDAWENGNKQIKKCPKCGGLCKPKIILYGEDLPQNFYENSEKLFNADLVFIIGTSLNVEPFASLVDMIDSSKCWTVLINKDEIGNFRFGDLYNKNLFLEGLCDEWTKKILEDCNWWNEFYSIYAKYLNN